MGGILCVEWRLTDFVMDTAFQVSDGDPTLLLFHFWVVVQDSVS